MSFRNSWGQEFWEGESCKSATFPTNIEKIKNNVLQKIEIKKLRKIEADILFFFKKINADKTVQKRIWESGGQPIKI